jgi:hypothetical protein
MCIGVIKLSKTTVVLTFLFLVLSGCSSNKINTGYNAFQSGDCAKAVDDWLPLAKKGDAAAQNNMGAVWRKGCSQRGMISSAYEAIKWYELAASQGLPVAHENLGDIYLNGISVSKDIGRAKSHYTFAARWGSTKSIAALQSLNAPVPQPDLLNQYQANQKAQEQYNMLIGMQIISNSISSYYQGKAAGYQQSSMPLNYLANQPNYTNPQSPPTQQGCSLDYECGIGMMCAKQLGSSTGVCLVKVNSVGSRDFSSPNTNSSTIPQCYNNVHCPPSFRCDTSLHMCVK